MTIEIFEAQPAGSRKPVRWAECASGPIGPVGLPDQVAAAILTGALSKRRILTFELPAIERPALETLVRAVLRKSFKVSPAIGGESILYLVVNESIHKLHEIAAAEGV